MANVSAARQGMSGRVVALPQAIDTLGRGLKTRPIAEASVRRRFAAAAFNAGEGRVAQAQRRAEARGGDPTSYSDVRPFLPGITRTYVDRVIRYSGDDGTAAAA